MFRLIPGVIKFKAPTGGEEEGGNRSKKNESTRRMSDGLRAWNSPVKGTTGASVPVACVLSLLFCKIGEEIETSFCRFSKWQGNKSGPSFLDF